MQIGLFSGADCTTPSALVARGVDAEARCFASLWVPQTPFFDAHTNQIAANHVVNGVCERWKIVPAVTDVCRPQPAHIHKPRRLVRHALSPPQTGQTNPSGQRSLAR